MSIGSTFEKGSVFAAGARLVTEVSKDSRGNLGSNSILDKRAAGIITPDASGTESSQRHSGKAEVQTALLVNQATDIAASAVSEIASLRHSMYEAAAEAEVIPQGERTSDLNSLISTYQTEINRISSSATFNGENVLSGQTYSVTTVRDGQAIATDVTVIPSAAAITQDLGLTLTSQSGAYSARLSYQSFERSAFGFSDGVSAAENKIDGSVNEALTPEAQSSPSTSQSNPVTEFAKNAANRIGSPYQSETSELSLIESSARSVETEA